MEGWGKNQLRFSEGKIPNYTYYCVKRLKKKKRYHKSKASVNSLLNYISIAIDW